MGEGTYEILEPLTLVELSNYSTKGVSRVGAHIASLPLTFGLINSL